MAAHLSRHVQATHALCIRCCLDVEYIGHGVREAWDNVFSVELIRGVRAQPASGLIRVAWPPHVDYALIWLHDPYQACPATQVASSLGSHVRGGLLRRGDLDSEFRRKGDRPFLIHDAREQGRAIISDIGQ